MGSWIVGGIVAAVVFFAARKVYTDRINAKGCPGGCGGCTSCPGKDNQKQD